MSLFEQSSDFFSQLCAVGGSPKPVIMVFAAASGWHGATNITARSQRFDSVSSLFAPAESVGGGVAVVMVVVVVLVVMVRVFFVCFFLALPDFQGAIGDDICGSPRGGRRRGDDRRHPPSPSFERFTISGALYR